MDLAGRVTVVTGSGNGIGEAIAKRFAADGAKVLVTDVDADAVERVAAEIGAVSSERALELSHRRYRDERRSAEDHVDRQGTSTGFPRGCVGRRSAPMEEL